MNQRFVMEKKHSYIRNLLISLAVFAVATVLMIAGLFLTEETVTAIGLAGSGAIIYWVGIMLAISWWRCPVCGASKKAFKPLG